MRRRGVGAVSRRGVRWLTAAAFVVVPAPAFAQAGPMAPSTPSPAGAAPGAAAAVANAQAATAAQAAQPTSTSTYVPVPGAQVGPTGVSSEPAAPSGTESSARTVQGDQEDGFDFSGAGRAGAALHGGEDGPIFVGRRGRPGIGRVGGEVPASHVVMKGETLWGICNAYLANPYEWPRVWSYNPQIKNPNWIYPGDEIRLRSGGPEAPAIPGVAVTGSKETRGLNLVDRRRTVPSGTVFLRDQGWIHDPSDDVWGEVTGAPLDKMFLTDSDEVYLELKKGHDVHVGQELTLFRTRQTAAVGAIVQVLGTVRINDWNEHDRVARAKIVESLDVIERGVAIGPVTRSFETVPPRRNPVDVQAHVLASLHPNEFFGQNQVVFIDKGASSGLEQGNRLFVIRRGDAWRQTLLSRDMSLRVSADDERPMPPMERTPGGSHDDSKYPDEVVAELRVVNVKQDSAACLVTQAKVEIELRDLAVARKGY